MKIWLTSDWHLGETRFDLMGRPFTDAQKMVNELIKQHNTLVAPGDHVIMAGDVCYKDADNIEHYLEQVNDFNGTKTLIRGNHDRNIPNEVFEKYFNEIVPEGDGLSTVLDGIPCYVTHYPAQGVKNRFNLTGHVHAAWKYQLNMLNIGVDVHHFRPVSEDTISFHYKALDFYDMDVWAAYLDQNTIFKDSRGKKSTYFKGTTWNSNDSKK